MFNASMSTSFLSLLHSPHHQRKQEHVTFQELSLVYWVKLWILNDNFILLKTFFAFPLGISEQDFTGLYIHFPGLSWNSPGLSWNPGYPGFHFYRIIHRSYRILHPVDCETFSWEEQYLGNVSTRVSILTGFIYQLMPLIILPTWH